MIYVYFLYCFVLYLFDISRFSTSNLTVSVFTDSSLSTETSDSTPSIPRKRKHKFRDGINHHLQCKHKFHCVIYSAHTMQMHASSLYIHVCINT